MRILRFDSFFFRIHFSPPEIRIDILLTFFYLFSYLFILNIVNILSFRFIRLIIVIVNVSPIFFQFQ